MDAQGAVGRRARGTSCGLSCGHGGMWEPESRLSDSVSNQLDFAPSARSRIGGIPPRSHHPVVKAIA